MDWDPAPRRSHRRHASGLVLLLWLVSLGGTSASDAVFAREQGGGLVAARRNLMPVPRHVEFRSGAFVIRRDFNAAIDGPAEGVAPRVERAVVRMIERLARQTGIPIQAHLGSDLATADLRVVYQRAVPPNQEAEEDESYDLEVGPQGARLSATTPYGVLRGLETFLQLVELAPPGVGAGTPAQAQTISELAPEPADWHVPSVTIADAPRFPWRGLLLDPGRHFLSLETIKRNLDAMAAVKLNVLHWHLTEDQGFRIESKVFPKLHELGSDGLYYTQDEVREIIAYARDRGIRVMPEFDMPGHATSWFVGYPELASAPGPYEITNTWGIQDAAMDPTREQTYDFLEAFIAEMAALFPDRYFHIGGDEVNGKQWSANAEIQQFIADQELGDNHGLQTHFNRRIQPLVAAQGKIMMGWDEIFQPGLPQDAVVHSWRGPEGIAAAARAGHRAVLSNGYYIDLSHPASEHYAVDPLGGPAAELTPAQRDLVLGGEATMWGEYVVDETVDSRIWPRTAAIAERLWSLASVTEVDDMYRRLEATSRWLEFTGVTHRSGYGVMLARLSGGHDTAPLRTLTDVVEPLKRYRRFGTRTYGRSTPLNRLVDAARPESAIAREFGALVEAYLADGSEAARNRIAGQLTHWRDNHPALVVIASSSPMLPEAAALSAQLRTTAVVGLEALEDVATGAATSDAVHADRTSQLEDAAEPHGALQLMVVEHVGRLVDAAARVR